MDISQKNIAGDNVVNIHKGPEDRILDNVGKKAIKEALDDAQPDEVIIKRANDGESTRYADQIGKFIKDEGYAVSQLLSLSTLRLPDGAIDGQAIFTDKNNKMEILIGYLKKKFHV